MEDDVRVSVALVGSGGREIARHDLDVDYRTVEDASRDATACAASMQRLYPEWVETRVIIRRRGA